MISSSYNLASLWQHLVMRSVINIKHLDLVCAFSHLTLFVVQERTTENIDFVTECNWRVAIDWFWFVWICFECLYFTLFPLRNQRIKSVLLDISHEQMRKLRQYLVVHASIKVGTIVKWYERCILSRCWLPLLIWDLLYADVIACSFKHPL